MPSAVPKPGPPLSSTSEVGQRQSATRCGCSPRVPTVPTVFLATVNDLVAAVTLCHGLIILPEQHLGPAAIAPAMIASRRASWLEATLWTGVPRHFFIAPIVRSVRVVIVNNLLILPLLPNNFSVTVRAQLIEGVSFVSAPLAGILVHCRSRHHSSILPRSLISRR